MGLRFCLQHNDTAPTDILERGRCNRNASDLVRCSPPSRLLWFSRHCTACRAATLTRPYVGVSVPTSWLPLPCPFADPKIHRRAVDRLELAKRNLQGPEFFVAQVEEILHDSEGAAPSVQSIATQLHVSRRTLVRRLEQHGTSVRSLTERHQRRCSIDLLADASLDVSEIADRLGYSEPSNFSRAFRRWFGKSPQEYRDAR
jgi:AraC-like DNA-binding protein